MRTQEQEIQVTLDVIRAQSWIELKSIIKKYAPFISYSRTHPEEWSEERLLKNMDRVRYGERIQFITRANGLRAKVAELVLANNYGDPWQ